MSRLRQYLEVLYGGSLFRKKEVDWAILPLFKPLLSSASCKFARTSDFFKSIRSCKVGSDVPAGISSISMCSELISTGMLVDDFCSYSKEMAVERFSASINVADSDLEPSIP